MLLRNFVLHGRVSALLWDDKEQITAEIAQEPILKEKGGYIPVSDHSELGIA